MFSAFCCPCLISEMGARTDQFQKIEFLAYLVVLGMLGPFQIDRACKNTPGVLFSAPELDSGKKLKIQKNRFYEKVPHGLPMGSNGVPMDQKSKVKKSKV